MQFTIPLANRPIPPLSGSCAFSILSLFPAAIALLISHPKGECQDRSCNKQTAPLLKNIIALQMVISVCSLSPLLRGLKKGFPWEKGAYFEQVVSPAFSIGTTLYIFSVSNNKTCQGPLLQAIKQASRASQVGALSYGISLWVDYPTAALGSLTLWQWYTYSKACRQDRQVINGKSDRTPPITPRLVGLAGATFLRTASLLEARCVQGSCFLGREAFAQSAVGVLALCALNTVAHDTYD